MKKHRIIAYTLATSMMLSSLNLPVFAEDQPADDSADSAVEAEAEAESLEDTAVLEDVTVDTVTSDSSVDVELTEIGAWSSGSTASSDLASAVVTGDGSSASLSNETVNKGKFSDAEDSIAYYVNTLSADADFELSGTVNVDALNTLSGSSNPQQSSFGVFLANRLWDKSNKSDGAKFERVIYGGFAASGSKATTGYIASYIRTDEGGTGNKKNLNKELVSDVPISGTNVGSYKFELKKSGNYITVSVDGKSDIIEVDDDYFSGDIYPGFYIARNCSISVSDIEFKEVEKPVSLEVTNLPEKTAFSYGDDFDSTGLAVVATYADGSKRNLTSDEYILSGYNLSACGEQSVTVTVGKVTTSYKIKVNPISVTQVNIKTVPIDTEFYADTLFRYRNIAVDVVYSSGTTETLSTDDLVFKIDGKTITSEDYITASMAGTKTVEVYRKDTDTIDGTTACGKYQITVSNATVTGISIFKAASKQIYYVGEELDTKGLVIRQDYSNKSYDVLPESEYTISSLDTKTPGTKTITITSKVNPSNTTSYDVYVSELKIKDIQIASYPRRTYDIGEPWDKTGLKVEFIYNNGNTVTAEEGKDYTIDTSSFDNSVAGECSVSIVPVNSAYSTITLPITVRKQDTIYWQKTVFGQSSGGINEGDEAKGSGITVKGNDDGNFDSDTTVTVKSWNGSGKITGDHDGIAYYYTKVSPDDNFTLTGDVYVRGYLGADSGPYNIDTKRSGQEAFGLMARDVIPLKGMETTYYTTADCQGTTDSVVYKIGDTYYMYDGSVYSGEVYEGDTFCGMTTVSFLAQKDDNGNAVPLTGKTSSGISSSAVFASNMVIAGGYSGTSWPSDPTAASYYKNSNINRINLMARTGVTNAPEGAGTKNGPLAISSAFPQAGITSDVDHDGEVDTKLSGVVGVASEETQEGDKYRITLSRVNVLQDETTGKITRRGVYAKCYNYKTGETMENYFSDEVFNNFLSIQSSNDAYVGFFASRWAIIDVNNIEMHTSNPDTDPVYDAVVEEAVTPALTISGSEYTNDTDYSFIIKANNSGGGYLTLKLNDKIIYRDVSMGKSRVNLPVSLVPNSTNVFTAIYTPSTADNLTKYDDVVTTFTVTHRDDLSEVEDLYVSPDGVYNATGTREDPLDLVTAIGFVQPGQKIIMLDGTYNYSEGITIPITNNGRLNNPKMLFADEGASPVIDFGSVGTSFDVAGSYWHIKGIDITRCADQQHGMCLGGKYNIIEDCKFYNNGGTGLQVSRVSGTQETFDTWPANNVILNCETWNNEDSSKINADGFGCKLTVGNGNVFEGCVSHHNVDDGWDLYTKLASGAIGETVIENCISYKQGYRLLDDGSEEAYGAGGHNGFKMGGENVAVKHYLKDSYTVMNEGSGSGVSSNSNPQMKIRNVVAYKNKSAGISLYSDSPSKYDYDLKGVVSYNNGSTDRVGSYLNKDEKLNSVHKEELKTETSNYFARVSGEGSTNILGETVTDDFFKSVDFDAILVKGRLQQDSEGNFILGDFLQRKTPYVHDAEDEVTLYGCYASTSNSGSTEETSTETTTSKKHTSSSGGGSGSSSSKSSGSSAAIAGTSSTASTTGKPGGSTNSETGDSSTGSTSSTGTSSTSFSVSEGKTFESVNGIRIAPPVLTDKQGNVYAGSSITGSQFSGNATYNDTSSTPWAVNSIKKLSALNIVSGTGNGNYSPMLSTKRADFIVMLVNTLGLKGTAEDNFSDVDPSKYYANALGLAKEAGIATGYGNGTFGPDNNITRQDVMVLVGKTLEFLGDTDNADSSVLAQFADKDNIADYATPYVAKLVSQGIVSGTDTGIEPRANITRAQMAVMIANVYDRVVDMAEAANPTVEVSTEETTSEETTSEETSDEAEVVA
jgi:hypothetical protein